MKNWFLFLLKKEYHIDPPKYKWGVGKIQINKIHDEKGDVTMDNTEIEIINRNYYQ